MASGDDFGIDDLALIAGIGILFYVSILKIRQQLADNSPYTSGGFSFDPTEPDQNPVSGLVDILVPMRTSANGQALIQSNEGFTLTPEPDGQGQVVGWGHYIAPGQTVPASITQAQANAYFASDLKTAENAVNSAVTVQLNQDQFDALVDLAFNIGAAAFAGSTLVQKLNAGDFAGAAEQFPQWDMANGQYSPGLATRREGDENEFEFGTPATAAS